jgi:beta-lactamase regulating signal transducer with metallopeptidase domain/thiol-disulfide isomerase/thioredoxin
MNQLIEVAQHWVQWWIAGLWRASVEGAIAIIVVCIIARWCTFISPRVVCWMWRAVCLKLLVALIWTQPVAIAILPCRAVATTNVQPTIANTPQLIRVADETPLAVDIQRSLPIPRPLTSHITIREVLALSWSIGMLCFVTLTVREWFSIRRLCRNALTVSSPALQQACQSEAARLGIHRLPQLRFSSRVDGPLLAGIVRPTIILPDNLEAAFDQADVRLMLAHELAHLKRRDLVWNWLPTVVGWLFFFHPLVWLLRRSWFESQEAACDELLLQNQAVRPSEYGRLLLKLSARWAQKPRASLAAAGVLGAYRNLERRIFAMTRVKTYSYRRLLFAASMISVIAILSVVPWRLVAQENALKNGARASAAPGQADQDKTNVWPEGSIVNGKILDHQGLPIAGAEVILLGEERIIVDAPSGMNSRGPNWLMFGAAKEKPPSTRTNQNGEFRIERKKGSANRLAVIAGDPLFWEVNRHDLPQNGDVELKLPSSGSLTIHCDLPGKPQKQAVEIELRTFDDVDWNTDLFRFHFSEAKVLNPGDTVFEHLPPARYSVERVQFVPTSNNAQLMTMTDRQLAKVESNRQTTISIGRKSGRPLIGRVQGLKDEDLRFALLTIRYWGPEEQPGQNGKPSRGATAFEVIPITSHGEFTTDPIPPGKYWAELFAVKSESPNQSQSDFSGHLDFSVPETGEMPKVEVVAKPAAHPAADTHRGPGLRVVDEQGKPLEKVEVMVHSPSGGGYSWTENPGGNVLFPSSIFPPVFDVVVRADGYASVIQRFTGDDREKLLRGDATLTVPRGDMVQLRFRLPEELSWPQDVLPEVFFEPCVHEVQIMRNPANRKSYEASGDKTALDFNMLNVHREMSGEFSFQLAPDTPPFYVGIHAPGFLRCFDAGPFTAKDVKNGVLTVDVPKPASLELSFDPGAGDAAERPFKSTAVHVLMQIPGKSSYIELTNQTDNLDIKPLKFTDLPPANYRVMFRTLPDSVPNKPYTPAPDPSRFSDTKVLALQAGEVEKVNFQYVPFDANAFHGKRAAVVRLETADGKPAAGRNVTIGYYDGHYGSLPVFEGAVPESGEITLTDITDAQPAPDVTRTPYSVSLNQETIGQFGFKTEDSIGHFVFRCPPQAGDVAPNIEMQNLADGETAKLSDFRGKLVLLDFWATWCGPCQPALEKLDTDVADHADAWKDKLVVIPISIDEDAAPAKQHLIDHGWTHLNTYWTGGEEETGWQAPALRAFVFNSIPHSVLIDRDGKILWLGHPLSSEGGKDLAARIDEALNLNTGSPPTADNAASDKTSDGKKSAVGR